MSQARAARAAGAALVLAVVLLAGCGRDDNGGALDAGSGGTTAPAPQIALVVDVTGTAQPRHGSITCFADRSTGTGAFLDPAAADDACRALAGDGVAASLQGRPAGVACTQQYGGPEVAHISGTFRGAPVDVRIDRADGCGIAAWDALVALVGPPG